MDEITAVWKQHDNEKGFASGGDPAEINQLNVQLPLGSTELYSAFPLIV